MLNSLIMQLFLLRFSGFFNVCRLCYFLWMKKSAIVYQCTSDLRFLFDRKQIDELSSVHRTSLSKSPVRCIHFRIQILYHKHKRACAIDLQFNCYFICESRVS